MITTQALDLEKVVTGDGSPTLVRRGSQVSYRSLYGARTESEEVFVAGARLADREPNWRIVELGFGVGTNFAAVLERGRERGVAVEYWSVERAPVPPDLVCVDGLAGEMAVAALEQACRGMDRIVTIEAEGVVLHLVCGEWIGAPLPGDASAVFFDPFAPAVEPECWDTDAFALALSCLAEDGVLVTYSAATAVRTAMIDAGLFVASLPGPGRKREVTIAGRSPQAVAHGEAIRRLGANVPS